MQLDILLALIAGVAVFVLSVLKMDLKFAVLRQLNSSDVQVGSKLVVAFLAGFIVYIVFTGQMANIGQKIGLAVISLLLIWANLFLHPGADSKETENSEN